MREQQEHVRNLQKWFLLKSHDRRQSRHLAGLPLLLVGVLLGLAACTAPRPAPAVDEATQPGAQSQAPAAGAQTLVTNFRDFEIVAYQGAATLGGDQTRFSRVFEQGKPVVLNFWAGRCPPCRAEMPAFQRVADEYHDRIIFVGIDVGVYTGLGSPEDAQQLLSTLDIRYPAAQAIDASPLQLYQVRSMPTTLFLSPNGRIVDEAPGMLVEADLRNRLDTLITASN